MSTTAFYPIGVPGQPWGAAERADWLARQRKLRSYADEVVGKTFARSIGDSGDPRCVGGGFRERVQHAPGKPAACRQGHDAETC